jgi:hypothetical protein
MFLNEVIVAVYDSVAVVQALDADELETEYDTLERSSEKPGGKYSLLPL